RLRDLVHVDADHGLAQAAGGLGDLFRVVEEGGGLHDGCGALGRVAGLEDAGADEDAVGAKLHHHGGVGRGGDAAGGEEHHRELAGGGNFLDQFVRGLQFLGGDVELVLGQGGELLDVRAALAHVG